LLRRGVVEIDPPDPLGAGEHPDDQEDQQRGHAETSRRLAREDAQEQERGPDEEKRLERACHRGRIAADCRLQIADCRLQIADRGSRGRQTL
jgi:hypothetical protein